MSGKKRTRRKARAVEVNPDKPPVTPDELHELVKGLWEIHLSREAMMADHAAPFEYLTHTFFEGRGLASADCVVWANRGGGKTFLGAIASVLDLVYKQGVQVRILGGSLEQSQRMHEHVARLLEAPALAELVDGKVTSRRVQLVNGSRLEVLAASQRSVRGTRVQKIRCDEVDLFDPEVWEAAQLATRSASIEGPWGKKVRGAVEALSTMHRPYGLMWELVGARRLSPTALTVDGEASAPPLRRPIASAGSRRVLRWGLLDVIEKCGEEHACEGCVLWNECRGRAKLIEPPPGGHVSVSDASVMKSRVDAMTWSAEMLCQKPRRTDAVFPEFEPEVHVYSGPAQGVEMYVGGMDFGYRSEAVVLLASVDTRGVVRVEREHVASGMRTAEHARVVRSWVEQGHAPGGIAWIGVDPAGRARSDQTGESNVQVLKAAGVKVKSRRSSIEEGLRLVRTMLAPASWLGMDVGSTPDSVAACEAALGVQGPRLFVHERCTRLIECLQRYHYPSDKPESLEPVKDGFDHACDALRYMLVNMGSSETRVGRY